MFIHSLIYFIRRGTKEGTKNTKVRCSMWRVLLLQK